MKSRERKYLMPIESSKEEGEGEKEWEKEWRIGGDRSAFLNILYLRTMIKKEK
jgi:hypothetical protein